MLARCLERDPKNRLQWIGDARLDLVEALDHDIEELPSPPAGMQTARPFGTWLPWIVAVAAVAVAGWFGLRPSDDSEVPMTRFTIGLGDAGRVDHLRGLKRQMFLRRVAKMRRLGVWQETA